MQQSSVRLVGGRVNGLGPTEAPVAQSTTLPTRIPCSCEAFVEGLAGKATWLQCYHGE